MRLKNKKTKLLKKDGHYLMWVNPLASFLKINVYSEGELLEFIDYFFFVENKDKKSIKFNTFVDFIVGKLVYSNLNEEEQGIVNIKGKDHVYAYLATNVYPILTIDNLIDYTNKETLERGLREPKEIVYTSAKFEEITSEFKRQIIGQDEAIDELIKLLKVKSTGFCGNISMMFLGSTGIGKTETSKKLAEIFYKDPRKLVKINCGEYTSKHEQNRLFGSPPGYIGSDSDSFLLQLAQKSNEYVFVFDEIEKSKDNLYEALLGLLDDGHIKDNKSNNLDFSKSIFIFTSNVGVKENLYKTEIGFVKNPSKITFKESVLGELKDAFSPEFLNRMDSIICFNFLSKDSIRKIVKLNLAMHPITITEELVDYVVDKAYSEEYGAREINRFIKKEIIFLMAESLLKEGKAKDTYAPEFKEGVLVNMA